MFNIADFLKKFSHLEKNSQAQKDAIFAVFKDVCGVSSVSYELKKGVLYIQGSPMFKSVVYTKKQALLRSLQANCPQAHIQDIR